MPELPEVETIRRGLTKTLLQKKIVGVTVTKKKTLRTPERSLKKGLLGQSFRAIDRRGKLLAFALRGTQQHLLIHLKMTGQLIYDHHGIVTVGGHSGPAFAKATAGKPAKVELPNKYTHVIFTFADGSRLYFNDQRLFGYLQLVSTAHKAVIWNTYGLEPVGRLFTWERFREKIAARRVMVKAALLNQHTMAGIGNIYADEICFRARIKPDRPMNDLKETELQRLYEASREIIALAIKRRGTTFRDYRDAYGKHGGFARLLKVYGKTDETCPRCKRASIAKIRVAGRGTHYCPNCQK